MSAERLALIEPLLRSMVDELGIAGVSVIITRRGRTVVAAQYGYRDRETAAAMTDDTIFRVYSMTKPVVATAFMTLVDDGRVALDDPVSRFIPAIAATKVLDDDGRLVEQVRPMRIVDLLTHTCGMINELQPTPVAALYRQAGINSDSTRSLHELLGVLVDLPLAFQPGQRWQYGMGLDVIGALIETIADQPLGAFLEQRIFRPLAMIDTAFAVRDDSLGRLAAMYGSPDVLARGQTGEALYEAWTTGDNRRRDVTDTYPADAPDVFARGGFGLFSTAIDYQRFAQMLLDDGGLDGTRILQPPTARLMRRNQLPDGLLPWVHGGQPVLGYGFGLGSSVLVDPTAAESPCATGTHGWPGAATTHYWVDPANQLLGILMAQSMMRLDTPDEDLKTLVYQAITDSSN